MRGSGRLPTEYERRVEHIYVSNNVTSQFVTSRVYEVSTRKCLPHVKVVNMATYPYSHGFPLSQSLLSLAFAYGDLSAQDIKQLSTSRSTWRRERGSRLVWTWTATVNLLIIEILDLSIEGQPETLESVQGTLASTLFSAMS